MTAGTSAVKRAVLKPQTLSQAHEVLGRMCPEPCAPLATWRAFRLYSERVYLQIADIDRSQHHESLYFAQYERGHADD